MATKSAMPYNNDESLRACAKECKDCEMVSSTSILGRPVEAENILETNQPTNHSLITDHYPK